MCGLAGIFHADGAPASARLLDDMVAQLDHRGPDGSGTWTEGPIGLAHRRLAIIDLSPRSAQPMRSPDGRYVLVYNGEVYNFRELRAELQAEGHAFHTSGDTEVVLKAWCAWGTAAVERFNGMFALAIWDSAQHKLHLARDRYGVKPLYYTVRGDAVLFASEVKALLRHPTVERRVCTEALHQYFTFQNVFSDHTLFEGVHLLPPASLVTLELGKARVEPRRWWDYDLQPDDTLDEQTCTEELTRLFEQAVNRQLVADTGVGAYLSGGIDSGSITCVAARSVPDLVTFTCGFDLSSASGLELTYDERPKAEYLSYLYGTEHYEVVLKAGDMERVMPQLMWHLEDPRVGQCYPNFYVARLASRFAKVVLSGAGGDELFAGYPWRYYASALGNEDPESFVDRHYAWWQRLIPDEVQQSFFRQGPAPGYTRDVFRSVHRPIERLETAADYINASLYFELKTFLPGLLLVEDKLSMAHGLETRVPFLDNDLVDFACKVPVELKLRELQSAQRLDENLPGRKVDRYYKRTNDGKLILRKVLEHFVPANYAQAVKQGFSAPDGSWFRGESVDYIRALLSPRSARLYQYLDPDTLTGLLEDHFEGRQNRRLLIWSCVCFEWWLRIFDPQ